MKQGYFNLKRIFTAGLILALLLFSQYLIAQQSIIKILADDTKETLPCANICIENLIDGNKNFLVSDASGKLIIEIKGKSIAAVSYLGYISKIDTLFPGQNKTIYLEPKIYTTEEMVVTAQYEPVKADKSIYKIQVININRLDQQKASNVSELLATQANIRISQDGALGSKINMHGLSGEHVKILIDGIPVIGRMDGNIDLSQLNLNNVDHIEIIDGPMSVVYGSNALAGAINIITKENRAYKVLSSIESYYETSGVFNFHGFISGKIKKNIASLSVARNFFDGYKINPAKRSFDWNPKRQYEASGYLIKNIKNTKLKLSGNFFNELLLDKGDLLAPYFETAFDQYFHTNRYSANLDLASKLNKKYYLNVLSSYSYYNRLKNTFYKDLTTLEKVITANEADHDTSIFNACIFRGFLSKNDTSSLFNFQIGYDINTENGVGKRIKGNSQVIADYAVFTTSRINLDKIQIQPGLRISYNTKYKSTPVYSINIKYSPAESMNFRGSFARGFRAPSLKELYLFFVDVNHNVQGNPDLSAESSYNANFSVNYNFSKENNFFSLDGNIFYNDISNIITLAQVKGLLYKYVNIDRYQTQGSELGFTYRLHPRFTVYTTWSLTGTSAFTTSSENLKKKYYYSNLASGLGYKNTKYQFGWSIDIKMNGKKPQLYIDANGKIGQGYLEQYTIVDITIKKNFFEDRLSFSTGIKNLLNYVNIISTGGVDGAHTGGNGMSPVGWGRSFFANLSFNFNKL